MFGKNLKYLRKCQKASQEKLAAAIGMSRSTLRDYENGVHDPGLKTLVRLSEFFEVPVDDMLKLDLEKKARKSLKNKDYGSLRSNNIRVLSVSTDREGREDVNLVPGKAKAGYLTGYADPEYIGSLPRISLPGLSGGSFRAFEVSGDSMPPVHDGYFVIGRYVENWRELKDGDRYVLVTHAEGIIFKRIENRVRKKGQLICHSDNPEYGPFTVRIEDVMEAWKFTKFIGDPSAYLLNPATEILRKLDLLQEEVVALKKTY